MGVVADTPDVLKGLLSSVAVVLMSFLPTRLLDGWESIAGGIRSRIPRTGDGAVPEAL
jgi:hypothetical protein